MTPSQVQAVVHLVASSVPLLTPDNVTVVDNLGKLDLDVAYRDLVAVVVGCEVAHRNSGDPRDPLRFMGVDVHRDTDPLEQLGQSLEGEAHHRAADVIRVTLGEGDGFVRIVSARDDGRVLGVQAVGAHVSELSGEFTLALEMGAVLEDLAGVIHAHPTLSEAFFESALKALGQPLHA